MNGDTTKRPPRLFLCTKWRRENYGPMMRGFRMVPVMPAGAREQMDGGWLLADGEEVTPVSQAEWDALS